MKLSAPLLSLAAVQAICNAIPSNNADAACIESPENCLKHPTELGIKSSLYDPQGEKESAEGDQSPAGISRRDPNQAVCPLGKGRGNGLDYDYGCTDGWCWRNCGGPFPLFAERKPWCWLKYESGKGGWTPCGRWQDCEWSYNNKQAYCAKKKKGCGECGCGC
ncbi:hypothetical protein F53441_9235 [Fusarium austroafricanum]|uniref:IDI-2 n=1 Tax=Fusarium austroafricanum TaxID=2364996 RepID=A0A8H4KCT8_9HYPO|nr:hypothetical protein F53441_9235 [Fusarium austroafricanum]